MEAVRCVSPEEFLAETTSYRAAEPIRTNLLGSVATAVATGVQQYDDERWWVLRSDAREVVGAAFRTAPYGLQLGPMAHGAATALASATAKQDDGLPWVAGPETSIGAFLDGYATCESPGSRRTTRRGLRLLTYEIDALALPAVAGTCRQATTDDFQLAHEWHVAFETFINGVVPAPDGRDRATLRAKLDAGALRFWCVDRVPVSMAAHALPVVTPGGVVTRVGPVYTPPEHRRQGYGAAVTAALTDALLAEGSRVMLYADADNPTSNSIYQQIGYRLVDTVVRYDFNPLART